METGREKETGPVGPGEREKGLHLHCPLKPPGSDERQLLTASGFTMFLCRYSTSLKKFPWPISSLFNVIKKKMPSEREKKRARKGLLVLRRPGSDIVGNSRSVFALWRHCIWRQSLADASERTNISSSSGRCTKSRNSFCSRVASLRKSSTLHPHGGPVSLKHVHRGIKETKIHCCVPVPGHEI